MLALAGYGSSGGFGVVEDLKGNDTFEPCRRVSDNVREIAVQGK
jgi:hypothetical protein